MPPPSPPWMQPRPPWLEPSAAPSSGGGVPPVEMLSAPCTLAEVRAVRAGCYVPLYGLGAGRGESVRALALLVRALGRDADPRAVDHAMSLVLHPALGAEPFRALARSVAAGECDVAAGEVALGFAGALGAGDGVREQVAAAFEDTAPLAQEAVLARSMGGGDAGSYREHYGMLCTTTLSAVPSVHVARGWFDFVLARRWAGLDTLRAFGETDLETPSRWLVASAEWAAGDDAARGRMADVAEGVLRPVERWMPKLVGCVARELAELVAHPWELRWHHLRCAAGRDHAAMSVRAWLHAATEAGPDDVIPEDLGDLGPEPSRAGRAAVETRQRAGEFLLDWFVPDREARAKVDAWAARALRIYHRLRGAALVARGERALRAAGVSGGYASLVWPPRGESP